MPLEEVQRIAQQPGAVTEVVAAAEGGTSPEELKASIAAAVGDTADVRTGEEQADESAADINDSLGFIKIALLVFAGIAVLVGSFLIFNTFAVTVAQRSREFALLRTLGASRRQVLNSVIVETLLIGFVASVARHPRRARCSRPGLRSLLASFGIDLPSTGTVIAPRTVIVGLVVGMITTLVSGLVPARRATHVQPVEAMREADAPSARGVSRKRLVVAAAVLALGLAVLLGGLFGGAGGSGGAALLGLGVVVMIFGVAVLAPVLVRPLARFIGAPLVRASQHDRAAGAREHRAPAAADGDHRVGADDRARARRLHDDLRRRPERLVRQGDRRAAEPLVADRHPRRRLLAGAVGRRPSSSPAPRASASCRRCAGTRPTSRASATRSPPRASTRRR